MTIEISYISLYAKDVTTEISLYFWDMTIEISLYAKDVTTEISLYVITWQLKLVLRYSHDNWY